MPTRILKTFSLAALLVAVLPGLAQASSDLFDTESSLQPPPGFVQNGERDFEPCRPVPAGVPLSLPAVVDAALCANPQTREVWANARVQAAQVGVAESAYLPALDGAISASRNDNRGGALASSVTRRQRDFGLSLSWLIYDFGGREANLKNANALLTAANASQDARIQTLFLAAVQAYYQLQSSQAARDAAVEAEKAAQQSFNAAEARYKVGAATPADKLQAQTAWSQAVLNRITAEGDVNAGLGALANVMGMVASTAIALAPGGEVPLTQVTEVEVSVQTMIDEALQKRPDLRAAQAQARAAEAAVDTTRAKGRPSLSLGINGDDIKSSGLPDAHASTFGLTLKIPLFSGFNSTYQIKAAEAAAEAKRAQTEQTRLQVALDVWNVYYSLGTAGQSLHASADLVASAEQSQRMTLGRYKAGLGTILDVLNAQSALASARQQQIQTLYKWHVARVSLAQAMGTLDRGMIDSLEESAKP